MNQNNNQTVELPVETYEDVNLAEMTMQEIVNAAIERGFKPQNKSNCFYHWNFSDEMAAYRFMQQLT